MSNPFGMKIVESDHIPMDELVIFNPRYAPDGGLDVDATAKASAVITGIGSSAIQPAYVEKGRPGERFRVGIDYGFGESFSAAQVVTQDIHQPTACIHHRKTFSGTWLRWSCSDCGAML